MPVTLPLGYKVRRRSGLRCVDPQHRRASAQLEKCLTLFRRSETHSPVFLQKLDQTARPTRLEPVLAPKYGGSKSGAEGTRTPDPHTASVVRYQLRHSPGIHRIRPLRAEGSSYTGQRECQITRPGGYDKRRISPRHAEQSPQNTGHPRPGPILWLIGTPTTKGDFVNRKELVTAVADEASLEQKTVDAVLRALQSTLEGAVSKGDKVSVPGFFAVSVGRRAAREGRNPATGATITIAAANTVKFTAGSALKEAANR
jgi:DNA-binding protein HU-beta